VINTSSRLRRGISHKWGSKWITKTELRRQHWLNRTALKERGLSDRWLQHLERWLAQQKNLVRLQHNPINKKWAPMRLDEQQAVETFIGLHELELKRGRNCN